MKLTKNRKLILQLLDEEMEDSMPPHSVGYLHSTIKTMAKYKWSGYPDVKAPDRSNINRTVIDLLNAGLIVVSRRKQDPYGNTGLPWWEKEYQLASSVERNHLIKECDQIHRAVNKGKNGVNFFGAVLFNHWAVSSLKKKHNG